MSYIFLWLSLVFASESPDAYTRGVKQLEQHNYRQASQHFTVALSDAVAPEVYYALGYALYHQDLFVPAFAAWQRGLLLQPQHQPTQQALKQLEPQLVAQKPWFFAGFYWSLVGGLLATFGVWGIKFFSSYKWRLVTWMSFVCSSLCAYCALQADNISDQAVVTAQRVVASSDRVGAGLQLFVLQVGDQVVVQDVVEGAVLIQNSQGRYGWLPRSSVISFDPWDDFSLLAR